MSSEKTAKFLLPSPNFNLKQKVTCAQPRPHILPSSGISLLPRQRQPPPIYSGHGSSHRGKYSNHLSKRQMDTAPKMEKQYCESCELDFRSIEDLKLHRSQHEKCPVDNCRFWGHPTVMDRHVTVLHSSGLFDKFKKLNSPEEIAAWREERRRRYPTVANVLLKQKAFEQKQKRGERLETNKSRFGNREDRKRTKSCISTETEISIQSNDMQRKENFKKRRKQVKKSNIKTKLHENPARTQKEIECGNEVMLPGKVRMFEGTAKMEDYEHLNKKKNNTNVLSNLLGMYGSDSEESESENNKVLVQVNLSNSASVKNVAMPVNANDQSVNVSDMEERSDNSNITHKGNIFENPKNYFESDCEKTVKPVSVEENTAANDNVTFEAELSQKFEHPTSQNVRVNPERDLLHRRVESVDEAPKRERNDNSNIADKENTFKNPKNYSGPDCDETVKAVSVEESTVGNDNVTVEAEVSQKFEQSTSQNAKVNPESGLQHGGVESSDEAPEESPIQRYADSSNIILKLEHKISKKEINFRKEKDRNRSAFNFNKVRLRKQNTMLEKLLERDIRHERNVLLQCIRFVCEQNFFGIKNKSRTHNN